MTPHELAGLAQTAKLDAMARQQLLVELYKLVRKHLAMMLGSAADCEDAVQESMLAIHRALPTFRGDANPKTWALTIATRIGVKVRRKAGRYVPTDDVGLDVAATFSNPADIAALQRGLATLAPKKRDAFVLMELFELSAKEAAQVLGTFANTAASRHRHACDELQTYFSSGKFDESAPLAVPKVGHG